MRKLLSLFAVLAIISSTMAATAPTVSVDAPSNDYLGSCLMAGQDPNNTNQIVAAKHIGDVSGASYFNEVSGQATVQDLSTCYEQLGWPGGTHVMPANAQDTGNAIYQVGFGENSGDGQPYFYYAQGSVNAIRISSPRPVIGRSYEFRVWRRESGRVSYSIRDLTTNTYVWTHYPDIIWPSVDIAWWGYETQERESAHGQVCNPTCSPAINLRRMSYRTNLGSLYIRTNLYCAYPSVPRNDSLHKNFFWDGSSYWQWQGGNNINACSGDHYAVLSTTTFTSDTLNVRSRP